MTAPKKITDLLTRKGGSRGQVVEKDEAKLIDMFVKAKCVTKTSMIMYLHDQGYSQNDIAATLKFHGVLGKSGYQMVRNTIDRVLSSRERRKTA